MKKNQPIKNRGFTLLEVIISLAVFSMIFLALILSFSSMNASNTKTMADSEASGNAQRVLEEIIYETRSAKSIYTPTTAAHQLSLETSNYLPDGQNDTFIDFFLCGSAVCMKKESQDAIALTPDSVNVTNLVFSQVLTGASSSVQVNLTLTYSGAGGQSSSISLSSTASPRSY